MSTHTPEDLDISLWVELDALDAGPSVASMIELAQDQVTSVIEKFNKLTGRGLLDEEGNEKKPHGGTTVCADGSNVYPQIRRVAEREVLVVHHDLGSMASKFIIFPEDNSIKKEDFERGAQQAVRFTEPLSLKGVPEPLEQARIAAKLQGILQLAIQADMTERLSRGSES